MTSAVDDALVTHLASDATLTTLLGGASVYFDLAPEGLERFVLVTQQAHRDEPMFQARGFEVVTYLVKAVVQASAGDVAAAVAARIDALLEAQDLTPTGYALMAMTRIERVKFPDEDELHRPWRHEGGVYEVWVSPVATP